jgi:hypothetical protein
MSRKANKKIANKTVVVNVPLLANKQHFFYRPCKGDSEVIQRLLEFRDFKGSRSDVLRLDVFTSQDFLDSLNQIQSDDSVARVIINSHGGQDGSLPFYDRSRLAAPDLSLKLMELYSQGKSIAVIGCFCKYHQ